MTYLSCLGQYMSSIQTWPSAWQSSQCFSRMRGKALKEVKTILNQVMLRAAAILVSQRTENVMMSVKQLALQFFLITYFHKLIHRPFDETFFTRKIIILIDKHHICISGHKTNRIKNFFPFFIDYRSYFFWVLGTLCENTTKQHRTNIMSL